MAKTSSKKETRKLPQGIHIEKIMNRDPFGKEGRASLTKMLLRLFDLWKISKEDQAALLGLKSTRPIARYRDGASFPKRRDLMDRVGSLLFIHMALRVLFPENRELVYKWPVLANAEFEGVSPIDYIKAYGFEGLMAVKHYLKEELKH